MGWEMKLFRRVVGKSLKLVNPRSGPSSPGSQSKMPSRGTATSRGGGEERPGAAVIVISERVQFICEVSSLLPRPKYTVKVIRSAALWSETNVSEVGEGSVVVLDSHRSDATALD